MPLINGREAAHDIAPNQLHHGSARRWFEACAGRLESRIPQGTPKEEFFTIGVRNEGQGIDYSYSFDIQILSIDKNLAAQSKFAILQAVIRCRMGAGEVGLV